MGLWRRLKFRLVPYDFRPLEVILREKAAKRGLDPDGFSDWLHEIRNLPPESGSLGPGDPGKLGLEKKA